MSVAKTEAVLLIDGQKVPLNVQQILSLTVSREVNKIPTARLMIRDGEVEKQDFYISNQDFFIPGKPVEIQLGTPKGKESIFRGIITKHSIKVSKDRPSVLIVECKDEAVRLSIGRKSRFFNDVSDSDVFREIIQEYKQLSLQAEDTNGAVVHSQIVQYFTTDWDFISMRAEAMGHYLFIKDGAITIQPPQLRARPVFKLSYGVPSDSKEQSRIWEFESEMDARYQFEAITASSWDFSKQALVEGANTFAVQEPGNIASRDLAGVIGLDNYQLHHLGRMLEGELTAFANAVKQKSVLNKSYGRVKFDGRGDILPGNMAELEGVGQRFNGRVFVSRVHHSFVPGRWFTEIQFGLPYCWFYEEKEIANPPALGLLPKVVGLQVGKVVQLKDNSAPDKDFRIKINIPGLHKDEQGIWARLANLNAGNQKGVVFLPNLGDEVVVGYIGQDAREPVILGSLFSENAPPPLQNDDNNYLKGFVTNNNHRIIIDEEKNTISLETAGGSKVVLDDQNGKINLSTGQSSVELSQAEVSIKSTGIKLEAQTIDINGKGVTSINSPTGGLVKLGNGAVPAAGVGTPISFVPPAVLQGPNTRVLI